MNFYFLKLYLCTFLLFLSCKTLNFWEVSLKFVKTRPWAFSFSGSCEYGEENEVEGHRTFINVLNVMIDVFFEGSLFLYFGLGAVAVLMGHTWWCLGGMLAWLRVRQSFPAPLPVCPRGVRNRRKSDAV